MRKLRDWILSWTNGCVYSVIVGSIAACFLAFMIYVLVEDYMKR